MRPETSAAVVRFIDSRFDGDRTPADVRRLFPQARNVEFHAMSLREIFVALAMEGRRDPDCRRPFPVEGTPSFIASCLSYRYPRRMPFSIKSVACEGVPSSSYS